MKYLINLCYTGNYITLLRHVKEDLNIEMHLARGSGGWTTWRYKLSQKWWTRWYAITIQIPTGFFWKLTNWLWKLYGNTQDKEPKQFKKEEESQRIFITWIKIFYKATVTKTACHWHSNRQADKWNRIEFWNSLHIGRQLIPPQSCEL